MTIEPSELAVDLQRERRRRGLSVLSLFQPMTLNAPGRHASGTALLPSRLVILEVYSWVVRYLWSWVTVRAFQPRAPSWEMPK